jgi:hypothetical protein
MMMSMVFVSNPSLHFQRLVLMLQSSQSVTTSTRKCALLFVRLFPFFLPHPHVREYCSSDIHKTSQQLSFSTEIEQRQEE